MNLVERRFDKIRKHRHNGAMLDLRREQTMEFLTVLLFVVVITTVNIIFSIVGQRLRRVFVFIPAFLTLSMAAYFMLSGLRMNDLGALASYLFGIVFAVSGTVTLIVAAVRYRPQAIK
jgi:hypothetical protein